MNGKKTGTVAFIIVMILAVAIGCGIKEDPREGEFFLPESEKLVVFTSHKAEISEPIIKEFEEQTGIWVDVVYGGTTDLLNTIKESDDEFLCDVMFGGSAESLEDCEEYFRPYQCLEFDKLNSQVVSKNDKWTPFSNLPIVIIYNNKTVYPTIAPRGWKELLHYVWEGKVALANPQKSGSSYTAIAAMLQLSDREEEEVIATLVKQIGGAGAPGSGAAVDEVANGTKEIGITLEATARKRMEAGDNFSVVYPMEGTAVLPDGTAILKNAKHVENAEKFIEFTVSKETQEMIVDRFYRRSVRKDIERNENNPGEIATMDFDVAWATTNKDQILAMWDRLVQ